MYKLKIQKALLFAEQNLDQPLGLEQLALQAGISKYHFHRLSADFLGISSVQLIKLLRIKRAAFQLAYRKHISITDIAYTAGFQSPETFSRGFKQIFNISPSSFRKAPDWSRWESFEEQLINIQVKLEETKMDTQNYDVELVELPNIPIAVISHRESPNQISKTIGQFIAWRKQVGLPPTRSRTFNLFYNDPNEVPENEYRLDIGCQIPVGTEIESDFISQSKIPKGRYAKLRVKGADHGLASAIHYLYNQWWPTTEYNLKDMPLLVERVVFYPDVLAVDAITDIFLPLA
ncbi:AraC family transcriptional regulator [Glaciecola sp. 1036]|uniref:AraC family transcriptional regulator n=1 Tax=Alteromonadaceae TaxID=72275 RepID=UPI003D079627